MSILDQDIQYLSGVGPSRKKVLSDELGISTYGDLLQYYPYKYVDRSKVYTIHELTGDMPFIQVVGHILSFETYAMGPRKERVVAHFSDGTGIMDLTWFNGGKYAKQTYRIGTEYVVFGRPTVFNNRINVVHPDIDKASELQLTEMGLQPYYSTTEKMKKKGLNSHALEKLTKSLVEKLNDTLPETLPDFITAPLHLMDRNTAFRNIHYPQNAKDLERARLRLKFEELFYIQLNILRYASDHRRKYRGYIFSRVGDLFNGFFHNNLPFALTEAQKRVIREIRKDMDSPVPLIADMSSDIFSRPVDVSKYAMIFGGAQKNFAPAGVTMVIINDKFMNEAQCRPVPTMADYRVHVKKNSMNNTPPVLPIYTALKTMEWMEAEGGVKEMEKRAIARSTKVYDALDNSKTFYPTVADPEDRSRMNICFRLKEEYADLEADFLELAKQRGLVGVKGHRSVGGFRASCYNALPMESVDALIETIHDWDNAH